MEEALQHLLQSTAFKAAFKTDAKLRVIVGRYREGKLTEGSKIALLEQFSYTVTTTVKAPTQ